MTSKTQKLDCGHTITVPNGSLATGYGPDMHGKRHCYDCCHVLELEQIKETGRVFAYLGNDEKTVETWHGSILSDDVRVLSRSRDNFGGERTYLRFRIDGKIYSGFGLGVGMYLRARRTNLGGLYS